MRITYDRDADAVYIRLADQHVPGIPTTLKAPAPPGIDGWIALDWRGDRLVGIEILDASQRLPEDVLEQAEDITNS